MSSSGSYIREMTDAKEAEKSVDETVNINLNDKLVEGESKATPLPHPHNPTENGESKAEDNRDSVAEQSVDDTVVEAEKQHLADDSASLETTGCNIQESVLSGGEIQANAINGKMHDDHEDKDVKLKSEDNAYKGSGVSEINIDADNNNEGSRVPLLDEKVEEDRSAVSKKNLSPSAAEIVEDVPKPNLNEEHETIMSTPKSFLGEPSVVEGYESGTEEEQAEFAKDVERFYRENNFEYKAPKFYKEELNLLKLWRAVIKLGGYEQVTSCKLWRQVGESFRPPKTCTTVSWTFRIFYEKALLEYEKHKMRNGELPFSDCPLTDPIRVENQAPGSQALSSGRARRDAAARAMQGWHSQRLLGNGQVCHPIIKDKSLNSTPKVDKQPKTNGLLKRKKPSNIERAFLVPHMKAMKPQADSMVIDIGPPADWVKINVQRTNDCFEIYALVPGLLREEVHVQSDPAGRLIISGNPEQLDNPWGVTPFKKVVSLPSRIDPHQTSAVVTLHGQLFVRVPFEVPDN